MYHPYKKGDMGNSFSIFEGSTSQLRGSDKKVVVQHGTSQRLNIPLKVFFKFVLNREKL